MRRSATIILALVATIALLVVVAVQAMPESDITLDAGTPGARLHTASAGYGFGDYDFMSDGDGQITFYHRAVSGPANKPRGAVLRSWTYDLWAVPRTVPGSAWVDSVAVTDWGTSTKVTVTPRGE